MESLKPKFRKAFDHQSGQYLSVDSGKIYYETAGTENKPVLLVLHGGFGTLEDLNNIVADLAGNFTLIGIDSRGHGKSTMGSSILTYERLQQDVEHVLHHLNINTLSIIGFSDGGVVAFRLASFSGLKIEKLVAIGSRWHFNNADAVRDILLGVTAESWKKKFPQTFEVYQKLNPEPDFDKLAGYLADMWLDPGLSGYSNNHIEKFASPLLIIRGDKDPILRLRDSVELAELVKNSSLLNIPFAGHAAFINQMEMVIHFLKIFFDD
jgi:pimeloyl-ACP methyl ester carboxylesterase